MEIIIFQSLIIMFKIETLRFFGIRSHSELFFYLLKFEQCEVINLILFYSNFLIVKILEIFKLTKDYS